MVDDFIKFIKNTQRCDKDKETSFMMFPFK